MKKLVVDESELEVIQNAMTKYHESIKKKIKELDECSSHFFVNEGLMNEVRIEKEKLQKELGCIESLADKLELTHE